MHERSPAAEPPPPHPAPPPDTDTIEESYRIEVIRKAIHLSSLSLPVFYNATSRTAALALFVPLTLLCLALDLGRLYIPPLGALFLRLFGPLLRKHESGGERKALNGATYVLLSATLSVLLFPKIIMATSFSMLIVCDLASALVGRRWGRHPFSAFGARGGRSRKTVEGTLAFFLSGLLVVALAPKAAGASGEYVLGSGAAAIGSAVEALSTGIDDNLTIPLAVGGALWAGYALFYPMITLQ